MFVVARKLIFVIYRLPVNVSGGGQTQLLIIDKLTVGTGANQAMAVTSAVRDYGLEKHVCALCFDTTGTNTGLKNGACVLIEKSLGKKLVWLACRHHVYELVLGAVLEHCVGPRKGPSIAIFQRFQSAWSDIDQTKFDVPENFLSAEQEKNVTEFCESQLQVIYTSKKIFNRVLSF